MFKKLSLVFSVLIFALLIGCTQEVPLATSLTTATAYTPNGAYSTQSNGDSFDLYFYDFTTLEKQLLFDDFATNQNETYDFIDSIIYDKHIYVFLSNPTSEGSCILKLDMNGNEVAKITLDDDEGLMPNVFSDAIFGDNGVLYFISIEYEKEKYILNTANFETESIKKLTVFDDYIQTVLIGHFEDNLMVLTVNTENPENLELDKFNEILFTYSISEHEYDEIINSTADYSSYRVYDSIIYQMDSNTTKIRQINLQEQRLAALTSEYRAQDARLHFIADDKVAFYTRAEGQTSGTYDYYDLETGEVMDLLIRHTYNNEYISPPTVFYETEEYFLISVHPDENSPEDYALILKDDYWFNRENYIFFS